MVVSIKRKRKDSFLSAGNSGKKDVYKRQALAGLLG